MLHIAEKKKILVTGGSGFLGRVLATALSKVHDVAFTYAAKRVNIPRCKAIRLNFLHPSTIDTCFKEFQPEVVVHAAALSNGAECESSHEKAQAVNVTGTKKLLKQLSSKDILFIYISTDLVFDGEHAPYSEQAELNPISYYGKTKQLAEQAVQKGWHNHVILRPALMYGPELTKGRPSFVQWMDASFQEKDPVPLFRDEFRTPVYVKDVAQAVQALIQRVGSLKIYHIGGPERMSRVEFGHRFAELRGYDASKIKEVKLSEMDTGYPRPADVSLDSTRICESHPVKLTPVNQALQEIFS